MAYRERITEYYGYIRRKHFNLPGHTRHDMNHRVIAIFKGPALEITPNC